MFPTLLIGDHLFVNKFIYGPEDSPSPTSACPDFAKPERGEVAVFTVAKRGGRHLPRGSRTRRFPREEFVKRIIGLPGDEIDFRNGKYYVNGELIESEPLGQGFRRSRRGCSSI